ncbi:hypothetical protein JTE90_028944 [Oedothorax gibbosus]|uniref:Uncharacterized protein n=1 Tax=Oedothorax gibbosus TaxID=931172 RepID=A0AAV6VHP7_9ARAC|nr:hypothetical protein JTE90_028944 [Oedothorax gibbosus]
MDFRGVSKSLGTRLAVPSTNMTPQLEDYDLFKNFRDDEKLAFKEDGPLQLVLNLACVKDEELILTFPKENVLQVQVVHSRRDMGGILFARDCVYKFTLPNEVSKNPLTALRTLDNYLVVVESSNVIDVAKDEDSGNFTEVGEPNLTESPNYKKQLKPQKVNLILKPTVNQTVLRHAIEHAEIGLFHAKRIVQNCCFVFPDEKKLADVIEVTDTTEMGGKIKMQTTKRKLGDLQMEV